MDGKNPCDVCPRKNKASGCCGCVLESFGTGRNCCENIECCLSTDGGCLLGFDDDCKASTAYEDDISSHDCSECVHQIEGDDGLYYCDCHFNENDEPEEIGEYDQACEEDFEERED